MSAYFCDQITIDRIVGAVQASDLAPSDVLSKAEAEALAPIVSDPDQLGSGLWKLNRVSMLARYPRIAGTDEDRDMQRAAEEYAFEATSASPVQLIKSIACWSYQSCESDDVLASPLYRFVMAVQGALALKLVRAERAYDRAEWG